jgi:hypothetical protein
MARFSRIVAPWNGVLIERTTGTVARVLSEAEARGFPREGAARRTRHLLVLSNSIDTLDLVVGQANILSGVPTIPEAVRVLDEIVVPAYAKARRLGEPEEINRLLAARFPDRTMPGPNCTRGSLSWNTLCMMETNPYFARNVVRGLIAKRLARNGVTFDQWRSAVRSPFSVTMQKMIGSDVIFLDAAEGLPESDFGVWAIELPKVFFDPDLVVPEDFKAEKRDQAEKRDCWSTGVLPPLTNENNEFDVRAPLYSENSSGRCHLIDSFATDDFLALEAPQGYSSAVAERQLVAGLLEVICRSNMYYPDSYCWLTNVKEVAP